MVNHKLPTKRNVIFSALCYNMNKYLCTVIAPLTNLLKIDLLTFVHQVKPKGFSYKIGFRLLGWIANVGEGLW